MPCLRWPAAEGEVYGSAGEDHVGGNISGPGLGISPGSPDELQDLPYLLLAQCVQLVCPIHEHVRQFGNDAVKYGFPIEGQPSEFLGSGPHSQDSVNQSLHGEVPVGGLLGVSHHNFISQAGHAHQLAKVEVEDGAGAAKCLLKIFPGNINFLNFLRQASQCLASESLTELVYLVICVDSILGSSGEPVPEYDEVLTCKPCKGGELDVARLVIHGVVLVVFNKVVLVVFNIVVLVVCVLAEISCL